MSDVVFQTERLQVRRWRADDRDALLAVYGRKDVNRFVEDGSVLTPDEADQWLVVTATNYARRGYGMFAMERDGEVIGFGGLTHPGGTVTPQLKYALHPRFWDAGYATEFVLGVIEFARRIGIPTLGATIAPGNAASRNVLAKGGFAFVGCWDWENGERSEVFHRTL